MNKLPDGPATTEPELLRIFTTDPFSFLKECYEKYGDMFTIKLGTFGVKDYNATGNWVFLCNSEDVKVLFKLNNNIIASGEGNDIQFQQLLPKRAMVLLDGASHIERRKLESPTMQSKEKIREMTSAMTEIVLNEIKLFPINNNFKMTSSFRRISGEIMRCLIFGEFGKEDAMAINVKLNQFSDPKYSPEEKIVLLSESAEPLKKIIREYKSCPHLANQEKNNLLNVLMNANAQGQLEEVDVQDEVIVLMLAGCDTVATLMAWIMTWVFNHPEVREKILEEITQVFSDRSPTAADFDKLPYLDAVIIESSRISPMFPTTSARLLRQPLELGGHTLPAGTMVATCPPVIQTRPDYYPEPNKFNPDRFMNSNTDPSQWLPFGGGIRRCLGTALALYEMKVVIATLFHQCKFEVVDVNAEAELQGSFFAPKGSVTVKLAS